MLALDLERMPLSLPEVVMDPLGQLKLLPVPLPLALLHAPLLAL